MQVDINHSTLLVTGGCGFLGSSFIRHLLLETQFQGRIINLDRLTYAGTPANLSDVEDDSRYTFVEGDVCAIDLVEKLYSEHAFSMIVHFAAETDVDRSIQSALPFLETNVSGTVNLLDFVRRNPSIHFHYISTDEVYGSLDDGESPFVETDRLNPSTPYAASKASVEHFIMCYHKTYGISSTISRSCKCYGPYQHPEKLIPLMTLNCIEKRALPIYGEGKNRRSWLYVDDHSQAIYAILEKGKSGEVYNVGGTAEWENIELVYTLIDEISNIMGEDSQNFVDLITYVNDRPAHDARYALNSEKLEKEIGFWPKWDFQHGIYKTIQWYIDEEEWVKKARSCHPWFEKLTVES